ncbi:MAG: hypothetical protein ACYDDO_04205 [Acidiferrobacterales bacterium]
MKVSFSHRGTGGAAFRTRAHKPAQVRRFRTGALVFATFFLAACTPFRAVDAMYFHSPKNLPRISAAPPIYVEPGAEDIAQSIENALPAAISKVEASDGSRLGKLPDIVVCATRACYARYGVRPRAWGETLLDRRIAINGEKIHRKGKDPAGIFTHELTHYFWYSKGVRFQPPWFEEGMAVWVSGGCCAGGISTKDAEVAIRAGKTINPTLHSGIRNLLWSPINHSDVGVSMFYRQSGMFIRYLHDSDPKSFALLLSDLRQTRELRSAWAEAYGQDVNAKWAGFVASLPK